MPAPDSVNLEALSDLCTPWCVHVVATLKVAEHIAAGTRTIDELAAACGADRDALQRVLRHLVEKGLFEEPEPGEFTLKAPAHGLLEPGAHLAFDLGGIGGRIAHAWGTLLSAVRTGTAAYHERFGQPFWEDLQANPEVRASFDELMGPAGHGTPDPNVLLDRKWTDVRSVVDVGGGTGALLAEILRAHPRVQGTLVDLPAAIANSAPIFEAAGVAGRVTTVAQSFFDPLPRGADVYLLKNLLADWPDREAVAILKRCAEAARPAGRVVIIGGVSPDEPPPPELMMLVLVGGRARSLAEFSELAAAAGLEVRASARSPSGRFIVECAVSRH